MLDLTRRLGVVVAVAWLAGCEVTPFGQQDDDGIPSGDSGTPDETDAVEDSDPPDTDAEVAPLPPETPVPARLHRLTERQVRATWAAVLGVPITADLPPDTSLHGYTSVGGGVASVSAVELEILEAAAWQGVKDAMPDPDGVRRVLGLRPPDAADRSLRAAVHDLLVIAWRRPATSGEVDGLLALYDEASGVAGAVVAARAVVAAALLHPSALYRVEVGEPDPAAPARRRLTARELASRLAYLLTDAPPDAALRADAETEVLHDEHVLLGHAERLLALPGARSAWSRWLVEALSLDRVALMSKDPTLFPGLTPGLRAAMVEEVRQLFQQVVFEEDADVAGLLTRDDTWVDAELAALYGVPGPADGTTRTTLPADQQRGGLLGRAGVLAVAAHDAQTSPTRRGKLVRERLLCDSIDPPPPGVVADLDAIPGGGTLRERLSGHAGKPQCASCHDKMDPLGFTLEHYDALGRWRDREPTQSGLRPIDATGELDGVVLDGARALGVAVALHPDFPGCVALQALRHALGAAEGQGQLASVARLAADLEANGGSLQAMILALVADEVFRATTGSDAGPCEEDEEGRTRACTTVCGEGQEVCRDGSWVGCDALVPALEACDGVDQDCDGVADQQVERACDATWGRGVQACVEGAWAACEGPDAPPETCNGDDDDGDGDVDEDLQIARTEVSREALGACDVDLDAGSAACHAAAHATCSASGCAVTGFGPVGRARWDDLHTLVCLDASEAVVVPTTFGVLATHHGTCTSGSPHGPGCYAAIHRFCGSRGEVAGFGPVAVSGEDATVVCTPAATKFTTSYTVLRTHVPACDGFTERFGGSCAEAFDAFCRSEGFTSGYGPLENAGDTAYVACVGGAP